MSKTVLAEINGWTPLIDDLVNQFGHDTAAAFGVVWRHCQMSDGLCRASLDTMAKMLGWGSRQRLAKHIAVLVENGYLDEEKIPGFPSRLYDTGKAGIKAEINGGVTQHNRGVLRSVTGGVTQRNRGCNAALHELNKKKQLRDEEGETSASPEGQPAPAATDKVREIYLAITGMITIPFSAQNAVYATMPALIGKYGSETVTELKKYYDEWRRRGYSKVNAAWLDWALAGEIPVQRKASLSQTETVKDENTGGVYL